MAAILLRRSTRKNLHLVAKFSANSNFPAYSAAKFDADVALGGRVRVFPRMARQSLKPAIFASRSAGFSAVRQNQAIHKLPLGNAQCDTDDSTDRNKKATLFAVTAGPMLGWVMLSDLTLIPAVEQKLADLEQVGALPSLRSSHICCGGCHRCRAMGICSEVRGFEPPRCFTWVIS